MSDDQPRRIPLSDFVEWFMSRQRAHYDRLLADAVRQIEGFDAPDDAKRAAVEHVRGVLTAELDRSAREVSELVARGMRVDEPLH